MVHEIPPSIGALMAQIELPPALPPRDASLFEDALLRWLTSPEYAPPGDSSIVAMLYDMVGRADCLRQAVDEQLPGDFQTFLFTTSLAHTGWHGPVAHRDLCVAGHVCGSRIVRRLDRVLTPQFLARCDRETHRALLLLLLGLILGVSYSTRLTTSPSFPHDLLGPEMRHSPTLWLAMKEHLAQMLAHHLIFLGSTLGIKLDTASEKTIIDTAVNRWNKPEHSLWAGLVGNALPTRLPRATGDGETGSSGIVDFNNLDDLARERQQQQQQQLALTDVSSGRSTPGPLVALCHPELASLQTIPQLSDDSPASTGQDAQEVQDLHDVQELPQMHESAQRGLQDIHHLHNMNNLHSLHGMQTIHDMHDVRALQYQGRRQNSQPGHDDSSATPHAHAHAHAHDHGANPDSFLAMSSVDVAGLLSPSTDLDEFPAPPNRSLGTFYRW